MNSARLPSRTSEFDSVPAQIHISAAGAGSWTTLNSTPVLACRPCPSCFFQPANALSTVYTPHLDWSDAVPDTDHYDLQVATDSGFASLVVDLTGLGTSGYTPDPLDPNTNYSWRVSAHNVIGQTRGWTAARTFRTALTPPTLTAPAEGSAELSRRPVLDWEDVAGATGYRVQISKNQTFTQVVKKVATVASTYPPTVDLPAFTKLFWRVQSKGANGLSAWSEARWFRTPNPPGIPTLVAPALNALTTAETPLLDWSNVKVPAGAPAFGHTVFRWMTMPTSPAW